MDSSISRTLEEIPISDMVGSIALSLLKAQHALDLMSLRTAEMMSGKYNVRSADVSGEEVVEAREVKEQPAAPLVPVPSVLGYTEVMARRKLGEANLLVDVCYQAVTTVPGQPIQVDRVVNQFPRQGGQVPAGSAITIFIGRES